MINAPVKGIVTYLSYLRNCADWMSVLRPSQRSQETWEQVGQWGWVQLHKGILTEWLWPSPTDWTYDY